MEACKIETILQVILLPHPLPLSGKRGKSPVLWFRLPHSAIAKSVVWAKQKGPVFSGWALALGPALQGVNPAPRPSSFMAARLWAAAPEGPGCTGLSWPGVHTRPSTIGTPPALPPIWWRICTSPCSCNKTTDEDVFGGRRLAEGPRLDNFLGIGYTNTNGAKASGNGREL